MRRTILVTSCLIACLATACQRAPQAPAAAQATAATTQAVASTRVGGVTLQTSTVATADINAQIAQRYGIDAASEGLVLLVTVRDDAGNAVDPGDLQLSATASVLPDPPTPLALRKIDAEGMKLSADDVPPGDDDVPPQTGDDGPAGGDSNDGFIA